VKKNNNNERRVVKRIAQALRPLPGLEEINLSRNDAFEVYLAAQY